MGFNKKIISEKNIKSIANKNDFELFFNYMKSGEMLIDKYSSNVLNEIQKFSIQDKNDIINIMNTCKL